jgi:hypothetical protein
VTTPTSADPPRPSSWKNTFSLSSEHLTRRAATARPRR